MLVYNKRHKDFNASVYSPWVNLMSGQTSLSLAETVLTCADVNFLQIAEVISLGGPSPTLKTHGLNFPTLITDFTKVSSFRDLAVTPLEL